MCCVPYSWNYTCGAKEKVVNFENLTNLTRWPQPAAILIVKICKNPFFGVAKLQEPNLVPTQRTKIDIDPNLSQKWRNSFVELSKKPLHTIRILGLTSYIVVVLASFF